MLIVLEGLDGAGKSTQVKMLRDYLASKGPLDYIHFPRYEAPVYGGLITRFLKGEFGSLESVHPQLVALLFAEDRHGAAPAIRESLAQGRNVLLDRYVYSNIAYQCAKLYGASSNVSAKNDVAKIRITDHVAENVAGHVTDGVAENVSAYVTDCVACHDEVETLRKWIIDTEFGTFQEPRPDLNIFLDVPIGFVENNLTHAREGADRNYLGQGGADIHESDIAFQKRVREMYLRQAAEDPSLQVVDCSAAGAGTGASTPASASSEVLPPEEIFQKIRTLVDKTLNI